MRKTSGGFGRMMRQLRLSREETLYELSQAIGRSVSLLSSIETGSRAPSKDLVEALAKHFALDAEEKYKFQQLAEEAKARISIQLKGADEAQRRTAVAFARRFRSLDQEKLDEILRLLGE